MFHLQVEIHLVRNEWLLSETVDGHSFHGSIAIQGGPLLVINGVITHRNWPYQWVTEVITPISGLLTPRKW